ncbi:MAG: tetratricopeptide repeat protein [Desulfobacteraceae bacterium]|nr:tetratricopeptide repeat protein [Desulfobacteraceae bacterium]MBC2757892.1 tetratricopeptide repeat protein [Desulfobacteraceae bacterium]
MSRNSKMHSFFYNHREVVIILLLLIMTFSVYFQVHQFEFVGFDDNEYVYENPNVTTGVTFENIIWAFTAFHSNNWHPLTWISHMTDCQIFGLQPGWHHLINLFFHIANAILLFLVFRKMTGGLWQSAFVAAVFAIHPLHVESVAWVSERKDVLSTFFWILTMWSYYWYANRLVFKRYILILLFFTMGLLSKPMLVTLPFVLLLLDYWPLKRIQFQQIECGPRQHLFSIKFLILEKIPLFFLSAISCFLTFSAQGGVVKSFETFSMTSRIANAFISYVSYIGKMIYPAKLAFLYPHPEMLPWWKVLGACLILFIITFLAIRMASRHPYFIVGWLWFLGTLVPVVGFVQVGMQSMADRYTYIPMIGLLTGFSWGISELVEGWKNKKALLVASTTILFSLLIAVTWKQVGYWKNSKEMLEHTLRVTSNNYIAHDTLGVELFRQGKTEKAIHHYLKAIQIYPKNYYTHFNLGAARYQQGKTEDAIQHYLKAIQFEPNYAMAHCNLGSAFYQKNEYEKATDHYLTALKVKPDYVDAHFNLGVLYYTTGKMDEAISCFLKAVKLKPDLVNAYYYLGLAFDKKGSINKAVQNFNTALNLKPDSVELHLALASELIKQERVEDAITHYSEALNLDPKNVNAHYNLGVYLQSLERFDKAIEHYVKALKIKPDFAEALLNLGNVLYSKGNIDGSISCYKKALQVQPGYIDAQKNLELVLKMK